MKLTLLRKGLILVSIPLCLEILVFSYLINAQYHLELEAQKINRNKKINDKVNLIFQDLVGIIQSVRQTSSKPDLTPFTPKHAVAFIADLRKRFEELEVLSQDEPEMLHHIQEGEKQVDLAIRAMTEMKAKLRAEPSDFASIFRDASMSVEIHFQNLINLGIFDWAKKNEVERELLRKEMWEHVTNVLKLALALSVLVGIAGSYWLSKQLVRRVALLSENATLMGQGKPLRPLQDGSDELAELDRNFHQAADLLQAAKRMRQEVTAMITHDLRTPLQTVLSFLEMLGQGLFTELNESGNRLLPLVSNSCHHMSRLIDNVLQLEKLRSGAISLNTSQIELTTFLENCIEPMRLLTEEKKVSINLSGNHDTTEFVEIDPLWLEQVVANVLSNALKFSPAGSSITITTVDETNASIIRIADQGPGIPAEQQQLIFDRFYRMKSTSSVPGTGLGLAIAKELVELHGGSIRVESAEGKGATFVLILPKNKSAATAQNNVSKSNEEESKDESPLPDAGRKRGLTLLHKGLILICIPLCFEIAIFGTLLNLQDQIEKEANRIDHNAQVNDSANSILRDLMQGAFALRQHQRKSDRFRTSDNQLRLWYADALQNFQKLEKLVESDDLENQVKRGEHGVQLLADKLSTQSKSPELEAEVISELLSMISYLAKRSVTSDFDLLGSELRAQLRLLLWIALFISLFVSAIAAIVYSRNIGMRLNNLGENAKLLAKGEPLLVPVKGTDEIAALDTSFHSAAVHIEAANRMRQEATAMITHDLRAPLQSLRCFLELLAHGNLGDLDEGGKKLLPSSTRSIERMEDLISSVLQLEELRSGRLKLQTAPVALASVLDKCLGSIKVLADKKQIALTHDYGNLETELIQGDAFWLEQVFVNILSNAIKFTRDDSTVSVMIKRSEKQIEVLIADQGVGIPPEQLTLIFERFHRVESAALIPGTGLGLPIAKELIELHHGSIAVESTVGKGSTFIIKLPTVEQAQLESKRLT